MNSSWLATSNWVWCYFLKPQFSLCLFFNSCIQDFSRYIYVYIFFHVSWSINLLSFGVFHITFKLSLDSLYLTDSEITLFCVMIWYDTNDMILIVSVISHTLCSHTAYQFTDLSIISFYVFYVVEPVSLSGIFLQII